MSLHATRNALNDLVQIVNDPEHPDTGNRAARAFQDLRESYVRCMALETATLAVLPDLRHYVTMHGPGPDTRLASLLAALDALAK